MENQQNEQKGVLVMTDFNQNNNNVSKLNKYDDSNKSQFKTYQTNQDNQETIIHDFEDKGRFSGQIISWRKADVDNKIILYTVQIEANNVKWQLDFRYSQLHDYNKLLRKQFQGLPSFPEKTVLKLTKDTEIDKRMYMLNIFLKGIFLRQDIINCSHTVELFNLEEQIPDLLVEPPQQIEQIDGFIHGVRDYKFDQELRLLFTIGGDMNVASRIDAYMTNQSLFWENKKNAQKQPKVSVGALECWFQKKDLNGNITYQRSWGKSYSLQCICLHWEPTNNQIYVGLDEGCLNILQVQITHNSMSYEEKLSLKQHSKRIMGIYYDSNNHCTYTISQDKYLKVMYAGVTKSNIKNDNELLSLVSHKEKKKLFIGNKIGSILIYDITDIIPIQICQINSERGGSIRGLTIDYEDNYVFSASKEQGIINVYSYNIQGIEKISKNLISFQGKKDPRCMTWNKQQGEIFIGYTDGTITVWNAYTGKEIYAFQAHSQSLNKLIWDENKNQLISASKEKNLKVWQFNIKWRKAQSDSLDNAKIWENIIKKEQVIVKNYDLENQSQLQFLKVNSNQENFNNNNKIEECKQEDEYDIQIINQINDKDELIRREEIFKQKHQSIESYYDDNEQ